MYLIEFLSRGSAPSSCALGYVYSLRHPSNCVPGDVYSLQFTVHITVFHSFLPDLLWTAPEHLDNIKFPRSKEGDVFSYGIILQEIITRGYPYSMFEDLTAKG